MLEILENKIIFTSQLHLGHYEIQGLSENIPYAYIFGAYTCCFFRVHSANWRVRVSFQEIFEEIEDPMVKTEILFHLDEILFLEKNGI